MYVTFKFVKTGLQYIDFVKSTTCKNQNFKDHDSFCFADNSLSEKYSCIQRKYY